MAEILPSRTAAVDTTSPPQLPRAAWGARPRGDSLASVASNPYFPTNPMNTPVTRSISGDYAQPAAVHPSLDAPGLQRVDSTLDAIHDLHNETVDDELDLPVVPENTPRYGSPSSYRYVIRNLPSIDEKLEALPSAITSPTSVLSFSNSPPPSVAGERGQATPRDLLSPLPFVPLNTESNGVREITDWHDTIEEDLDRDLTRLANLANDDVQNDPSATAAEHYHRRLMRLLSNANRRYTITQLGDAVPSSTMAERGSLVDVHPTVVTNCEFQTLRSKVQDMQNVLSGMLCYLGRSDKEVQKLGNQFEEMMKQNVGRNRG